MFHLVHDAILHNAMHAPQSPALACVQQRWNYGELGAALEAFAQGLLRLGLQRGERVAVYLEKRLEGVAAMFGAAAAGAVFVPVNPLLKPAQLTHILRDCGVRMLVTSPERLAMLEGVEIACPELRIVVTTGSTAPARRASSTEVLAWDDLLAGAAAGQRKAHRMIDGDIAAILYTSGSTGQPKGVILSHRNLVAGADSVATYLDNSRDDRILSVLPLSFDYGLNQLTTAFQVGASAVLMNYLLPRDIPVAVAEHGITGLAAVPALWMQLARQTWPQQASLRYITNSGGAMPQATLALLRQALPATKVFLMYGLTEAFRSTYLPPDELDRRPDSIGRAIPNAEVMVLRPDGSACAAGETGELVHRGALVALGYWNDPARTAERFRPLPHEGCGLPLPEMAVWSGDKVRMDDEGFLYFVGRHDDMIKVSGYRVSPNEVEEIIAALGMATEAAAFGVPHPALGQAIVVAAKPVDASVTAELLLQECRRRLPAYMVPSHIALDDQDLPRNPNGKIDRKALQATFSGFFDNEAQA
ncbi:acyl-CoA ligase (AMP-forming), exosortase A system-associated [Janthinobacterium sp. 17J80-10]|uniref:acyl-CoA ligase (AMP-forming), exosortase A system-associated n=1 Tax=Janthinobacterium sp. 17J80-10 TaxID=2497863 RepID=UPI00100532CD|nr:acyl-CoA ligase (AMP-forming), exosortase A system-associated [Janthinobacterium sp. 17J80-10]QAU36127.1 acyl-CoA ligase (AMP-forming), exosortase A system-associated [Janthinobacterium sp. 17J80-10]